MRHVTNAAIKFLEIYGGSPFITIDDGQDVKGVPSVVSFTIQSDPVSEVGVNGCQALDMLKYTKCLFESLNESLPCNENELTIIKLQSAIHLQELRTEDRQHRNVEGFNKQ